MNKIRNIIHKTINEYLNEVRYVNPIPDKFEKEMPIKDDEVITVYHGFNTGYSAGYAIEFAKFGFSGKKRASRLYSYEYDTNPRGLFVTVDFDVAKRFTCCLIMEFRTKVSDLEAPVWPDGRGFYVQGEYTKAFKDEKEREEQILKNREREKSSKFKAISKSDRPELAHTIYGAESQALFVGDMNPNMIKAFWIPEDPKRNTSRWVRLSRKEFIKKNEEKYKNIESEKIFMPYEDFDENKVKKYVENRDWDWDRFLDLYIIKNYDDKLNTFFHPKQIEQIYKYYNINHGKIYEQNKTNNKRMFE